MTNIQRILQGAILLGLVGLSSACVVPGPGYHDGYREGHESYREGYYDRDHHRYWHENGWRDCGERDDHCR